MTGFGKRPDDAPRRPRPVGDGPQVRDSLLPEPTLRGLTVSSIDFSSIGLAKRTIFGLLVLVVLLSLAACGVTAEDVKETVAGYEKTLSGYKEKMARKMAAYRPDDTLERAEYTLGNREHREARRLAGEVLARNPDNKRALLVAAWSDFKLGSTDAAQGMFSRVQQLDPLEVQAPIGLGWTHYRQGRLNEAEEHFLRARARGGQVLEQWDIAGGLGWVAFARGDMKQAGAHFRYNPPEIDAALADDVWDVHFAGWAFHKDGLLGRAWIAMWEGEFDRARDLLRQGASRDPDYYLHYDGLARIALIEGNYDEALRQARKGLGRTEHAPALVEVLDAVIERIGGHRKGIAVYDQLADEHPRIAAFRVGLGRNLQDAGRLREAEAVFIAALDIDPDNVAAKEGLTHTVARMNEPLNGTWRLYFDGLYERALTAFQSHQRRFAKTNNPATETGRGWSLLSLGRIAQAVQAFQAALKIDPNFASAKEGLKATAEPHPTLYAQAWALAEAGQFDRAKGQFERARKHAPADFLWKIDDGLAWLILYRKDITGAERAFRKNLKAHPGAYLSRKGLGYAALARRDYSTASMHLMAALSEHSKQVLASYTFPVVQLIKAGQFKTAKAILDLGDASYPDSPDINFLYAKTYKGLGQWRQAADSALRAATLAPIYIHPAFDDLGLEPASARDAYLALARGLFFAGDNAGAVARADAYIKAGGTDPQALRIRGFAHFRQGRYREANADLLRAVRFEHEGLEPVSEVIPIPGTNRRWRIVYDAGSTLAWSYLRQGNAREAAAQFGTVLQAHSKWTDALTGMGYSLLALGDPKGAAMNFRRALLVSPGYPDAWQGIAVMKAKKS